MGTPLRTLGRYELIARIGEGGMAEVYLARQRGPMRFEKLVVVKLVHPQLTARPEIASMLLEEARIAALVKHPNVVDIYDLGEEDGTFFIAMEYLEGESMAAILRASRTGPRLDPLSTAKIIVECAVGLHAAHELRNLAGESLELVHQDVTPGNVIVLYTGQVKLVDFGVATIRTTGESDVVKGKSGYLAPELLLGHRADRRSDVFSLGVVLWEALTLRRLFFAPTDKEIFAKRQSLVIPAPSQLASGVLRELDDVCMRALERDPAQRFATALEMSDALGEVLRHASWVGDSAPIARFMHATFADRIAARQQLLRELSRKRLPRAATLERIQAISDEIAPIPEPVVLGSHGIGRRETEPPPEAEPEPAVDAKARMRRRAAFGVAAAVVFVAAIGAATTLGHGSSSTPEPAVVAADRAPARSRPPPAPLAVVSSVAIEAPPTAEVEAVVVEPDHHASHHHHDIATAPAELVTARSLYKDGLQRFVGGDTSGAIARFRDAIARDGSYAAAYRGIGMAYERQGDRARAARAFRTYLRLAPGAPDAAQIQARLETVE